MRRFIALSAFIGLFATISFLATNRIESAKLFLGGISLFSDYKESYELLAKREDRNGDDDEYKKDKGEEKWKWERGGGRKDYYSGDNDGGSNRKGDTNGDGVVDDRDSKGDTNKSECGNGQVESPAEECEEDSDCSSDELCNRNICKCEYNDTEGAYGCNDTSANKGNLWIEGSWTCNNKNGKGGVITMHMKGKDVKDLYGRESYSYNFKLYDSPKGKNDGIECKKGRLKTRYSFSGIDKSDVYIKIQPKSYKKDGCYQKIKKWSFDGEYNGKEFKIKTPSNCFLKTTESGHSGEIYCYDLDLDIEEEEKDDDEEDEDDKYNKEYSKCVAQGKDNKKSDCISCLTVNCSLNDNTAWKDCVSAGRCYEASESDEENEDEKKNTCDDPNAKEGNLSLRADWNCIANDLGGKANLEIIGEDAKKIYGTTSKKISYIKANRKATPTETGISCAGGGLQLHWADSGETNSNIQIDILPTSYSPGCYKSVKKWEFKGKQGDKTFKTKKPENCYIDVKQTRAADAYGSTQYGPYLFSGTIKCYNIKSDIAETKEEAEDEDKENDDDDDEDKENDDDDDEDKEKKKDGKKKDEKKKDEKKKGWDENEEEDEDIYQIDTSVYYILDKKDSEDKKEKKYKASAPEKEKEEEDKEEKKEKKDKNIQDNGPLGCFSKNGNWTNNRSNCDKNQRKHYQKAVEEDAVEIVEEIPEAVVELINREKKSKKNYEIEEKVIEEKLNKKYSNSDKFKKKRNKLLKSIEKTQKKIKTLRKTKDLAQQVDSFFLTSLNWLETQHNYVKDRNIDKNELNVISDYIKKLVISIEDLLKDMPKTNGASSNVKIDGIFSRVAVLIDKFPKIVSALWQVGIDVDENTVGNYFEMRNDFLKLWDECRADTSVCADLGGILDKYEDIKESLEEQINKSGSNDAKDMVRKMLEK